LEEYGRAKGLRLLGDLPFYVLPDSSDVWANPQLFRLDNANSNPPPILLAVRSACSEKARP
jgi:4-alpha-glucanotransferase